ncbi:hypothetical protein BN1708_019436, partial [Verticillium longisporum]
PWLPARRQLDPCCPNPCRAS